MIKHSPRDKTQLDALREELSASIVTADEFSD
jgi:hypothetical protein